jgi:hypothetical protein
MLSSLIVLALSTTAGASWNDCTFHADRRLEVKAADVRRLLLETGAGDLRIVGSSSTQNIEFVGKACASTQACLDKIQLDSSREGNDQHVGTVLPDSENSWHLFGESDYAYLDLEVRVPAQLALVLKDSSGDIDIEDAGPLELTDSSGDIHIRNAGGGLRITDTSGDIIVDEVKGKVTVVSDSSGDIDLRRVHGDAKVLEDSSGDIEIADIGGNAEVGKDSSGDIRFSHITGSADVGRDSSGSIVADNVRGGFTVGAKSGGSRNISYRDVAGPVSLPDGN